MAGGALEMLDPSRGPLFPGLQFAVAGCLRSLIGDPLMLGKVSRGKASRACLRGSPEIFSRTWLPTWLKYFGSEPPR